MSTYLSPDAGPAPAPQDPSLGGIPGLPPGLPPQLAMQPPDAQGADPLASVQDAIHAVSAAMTALPDAQSTQEAAQALVILARIQTRLMTSAAPQG